MSKKNTRYHRRKQQSKQQRKSRRQKRSYYGGVNDSTEHKVNDTCNCDKCLQAFKYNPPPPRPTRDYGIYEFTLLNTGENVPTVLFNPVYPNRQNFKKLNLTPENIEKYGKELQNFNPEFQKNTIDSMFSFPTLKTYEPYKQTFVLRSPFQIQEHKEKE